MAEIDAARALVGGHGASEADWQQVRRDDAHDACVHALGQARRARTAVQPHGIAVGVFALKLVEQLADLVVASAVEHADDFGHRLVLFGNRFKDIGDVACQIVRCGKWPERVGLVVLARAQRAGDGE